MPVSKLISEKKEYDWLLAKITKAIKSHSFAYAPNACMHFVRDQTSQTLTAIRTSYEIIIPPQSRHAPTLIRIPLISCLELHVTLKRSSSVVSCADWDIETLIEDSLT